MTEPVVIPRAEHSLSRRQIDPDALKVLYRLKQFNYVAYLVGGSVRDLLLGRHPKDFDIGTSAHPYEIKRLFRNCWIIGRRFRLAHVKFGPKVIEVATFRRAVPPKTEEEPPLPHPIEDAGAGDHHHRDNTFGTPEEDAFRRDFTVNALFYDIASFSIIDYIGGLDDLKAGLIRSIGEPGGRLREDPVRMVRAVSLASRLDFTIEASLLDAIRQHAHHITESSPARLLEELFKILRAGASERAFRMMAALGLLEHISPELHHDPPPQLWSSLGRLDTYRRRFTQTPETLTNPVLLGSLLVPLGFTERRPSWRKAPESAQAPATAMTLGMLPIPRRDVEHLRQVLALQHRLVDVPGSPRARRSVMIRSAFRDSLTWLEIHGEAPDILEHWRELLAGPAVPEPHGRRRRRRRRRRRFPPHPVQEG